MVRQLRWLVLLGLALVIAIVYWPAVTGHFISDDFQYVPYLFFNVKGVLSGDLLEFWFLRGMDGYLYFRPFGHALFLTDFLVWNRDPLGYHLTNVILYLLSSFLVFLFTWLLLRRRLAAITAGALFAVLPIHAEAVSWAAARYDVLAGLCCLGSLIFFVLCDKGRGKDFFITSLAAFILALASKESAFALPPILVCYDLIFSQERRIPYHIARQSPLGIADDSNQLAILG